MSSKGKNVVDSSKGKGSAQSRKNNRRRSQRHASISNGDQEDTKERAGKRGRDNNKESNEFGYDEELYKSVIDLVPSTDYNCAPNENPAIPGTLVNLHGVILHETQGGLIVLNVRWRNQVYSGALIDIEKTKWASERIPTEGNLELSKFNSSTVYNNAQPPIKKLRIPTSTLNQHITEDSDSGSSTSVRKKGATSPTTPSKAGNSKSRSAGGKKRNSGQDVTSPIAEEPQTTPKKTKLKILTNGASETAPFECPEPNCGKKYKNKNGLAYHQKHRHVKKAESFEEKETKSDDSDSDDDNFVIDEKAGEDSSKEDEEMIEEKNEEEQQHPKDEEEGAGEEKTQDVENSEESLSNTADETKQERKEEILTSSEIKREVEGTNQGSAVPEIKEETPSLKEEKPTVKEESKPVEIKVEEVDNKQQMMTTSLPSAIQVVRSSVAEPASFTGDVKTVSAQPPNIIVVKTEEERQRSGSSQIIIHGDHENSLKELFLPPTQALNQYSPTLSNLNPQKLNQNMTEALTKQPSSNTVNAVVSTVPLIITRIDPNTTTAQAPLPKSLLTNTASVEIKPNNQEMFTNQQKMMTYGQNFLSKAPLPQVIEGRTKVEEVDCSDSERSVSPENLLLSVHHVYPQKERQSDVNEIKPFKGNNILTSLSMTPGLALGGGIRAVQAQKTFENSLIFQELASKVSSEAANMSPQLFSGKIPPVQGSLVIDQKAISPQLLRSLSSEQKLPLQSLLPSVADKGPLNAEEMAPKPSLLHQRLMGHDTGNMNNKLFSSGAKHQQNPLAFQNTRPSLGQKMDAPTAVPPEFRLTSTAEKMDKIAVTTSLTLSTNRLPEKAKTSLSVPSGLRINPPPEERQPPSTTAAGWQQQHPDALLKDGMLSNSGAVSSQYRVPLTMTEMQIFATSSIGMTTADTRQKMLLKRTTPTIPIAPAPSLTNPGRQDPAVSADYTVAASSGTRDHFTQRFTLTSDNRLVSSPAENRGRPKKIRVEKTELIPVGTVQEVARSRGTPDSPLPRSRGTSESPVTRKVTSPVVRASVIQGSLHSGGVQTSLAADHSSPPKKPDVHMFALPRNVNDHGSPALVDERVRFAQQVKMSTDARIQSQLNDKYREKNIKSPPGMYFSQQSQRRILSPPTSRSPAISPRVHGEVLPRSPPSGFPHELAPPGGKPYLAFGAESREKFPFPMNSAQAAEHVRNMTEQMRKQDIHRSISEPGRPGPVDSRKSVLSPREASLGVPPSFGRPHHDFEKEYSTVFSRHQSPRGEMIAPRDMGPRSSIYDHRSGHEESDQARMMARDRYLMTAGLPSQSPMFGVRNTSSPPPTNVPSSHSSNLALGRADGSILTKLPSSYESRASEQKR